MSQPAKKKKESKSDSPLSAVARWFTETKQYFLALAASIAAFGVLQHQIAKIDWTNWVVEIVAIIPPLLVFCCKTLPRLIKEHRGKILVESSKREIANPRPAVTDADYFWIGSYPESRRQRYDRADGVHKKVLSWLKETSEPVVILSGLSGAGKTSMLEAFLIPELCESQPPFTVLLIRGFDDPLAELHRQLREPGVVWKEPPNDLANLAPDEVVRRALSYLRQRNPAARLLAVLDQFEELITLRETGNITAIATVTNFLLEVQNRRIDGFSLLVSVRADYEDFLESLGVPALNKGRNWHEVPAFLYSAALAFLGSPESGLTIHEERLRRVLREAVAVDGTPGLIRPIILNMLGVALKRIADSPEAERPTRTLLIRDLRAVIDQPDRRATARAILPHMLTEADTKQPMNIAELCSATKLDAHKIHGCLLYLETSGYVRQVSRPIDIMSRVWEVSHDFVARLLGPILRNPFRTFWERFGYIFYPVSAGAWALAAASLIFAGPWFDRKTTESQLEKRYNFSVQETEQGYVLQEQDTTFNRLLAASSLLRKLGPIALDLSDCDSLTDVAGLGNLGNLRQLNLANCTSLTSVYGLKNLGALVELNLSNCRSLTNVDGLENLGNLRQLLLSHCTGVTSIDPLKDLKNLKELNLYECTSLISIEALKNLKNLERLNLTSLTRLSRIDALRNLKNLEELDLSYCTGLINLDGLKTLKNLRLLDLSGCRLTNVDELKDLESLEKLNLTECRSLTNVDGLKGLENLRQLYLSLCTSLTSVDALGDLKNLWQLNLTNCTSLTSVYALKNLGALAELNLSNCRSLTNVDGLENLENLQALNLSNCTSLTSIDALKNLKNLKELNLQGCNKLPTKVIAELHKQWAQTKITDP